MMFSIAALFSFFLSSAFAGPSCDRLASDVKACTLLGMTQVSTCIRRVDRLSNCMATEGREAAAAAERPAWDAYIQMRIDEHKRIYGQ